MGDLVLDAVDQFVLPKARQQEFFNQIRYLHDVHAGLAYLAQNVAAVEAELNRRSPTTDKLRRFVFGNHELFEGLPMPLINCSFGWFAVSGCNFIRVVGSIREALGVSETSRAYLERINRPMVDFRDKVGAHPVGAITTAGKKPRDNDADRQASFFPQVAWINGRLRGGSLTLMMNSGLAASKSTPVAWSVTETFEEMTRRYWSAAPAPGSAEQPEPVPGTEPQPG